MEQQRYGFNKEQGTKGTANRAAIFLSFLFISHLVEQGKSTPHFHLTQPQESVVTLL